MGLYAYDTNAEYTLILFLIFCGINFLAFNNYLFFYFSINILFIKMLGSADIDFTLGRQILDCIYGYTSFNS